MTVCPSFYWSINPHVKLSCLMNKALFVCCNANLHCTKYNRLALAPRIDCTLGGRTTKSTRLVLGYSHINLLVYSHRSLIHLLHTACFARALHCAHSSACMLTHLLMELMELMKKMYLSKNLTRRFHITSTHGGLAVTRYRQ